MLQVLGIDHVVLRVADRAAALAFYCGILGLSVEREQPELGLTQLRAGRSLIDLVTIGGVLGRRDSEPSHGREPRVDQIALEMMPFDAAAVQAHLADAGVAVMEADCAMVRKGRARR